MPNTPGKKKPDRTWWIVGLIALLVGGGVLFYTKVYSPLYVIKHWGEVVPGKIYRSGDLPPYAGQSLLAKYNIGVIVKLSGVKMEQLHHRKEAEAAQNLGVQIDLCPMSGSGVSSPERYADAVEDIVNANRDGKAVLVHCAAGTNRTGGVIAVYRMLIEHKSADEAYAEMLKYDFNPEDNKKLLPFLNANLPTIAQLLLQRGVISSIPSISHLGPPDNVAVAN